MANLSDVIVRLREERARTLKELRRLERAIAAVQRLARGGAGLRRRKLSPAARRRISEAQKARWARYRKMQKTQKTEKGSSGQQ
jgi:hypothetical protein